MKVLDYVGQRCPLPVIGLAKAIAVAEPGDVVRVMADDPAARLDIPAWCRMRRHTYLGESSVDGVPAFDVQKASL